MTIPLAASPVLVPGILPGPGSLGIIAQVRSLCTESTRFVTSQKSLDVMSTSLSVTSRVGSDQEA